LETKDALTLVGLVVSIGGLVIALVKLAQEQRKANELKQQELDAKQKEIDAQVKVQKRTEYKLRIYQSLIDDRLAFDALVAKFRDHSPLSEIDQVELRKCIYEMLVEGTLVTYQDKTYASYTMDEEDEDGEDEGEDGEDEGE